MALVLKDRVQEQGTANTTVSFTLSGAVTGFQSFAGIGNGNTTYYAATDASGHWEVGEGTYSTTGPTLTRTTILSSSNSGSAVTFSGTVNVFVTLPAEEWPPTVAPATPTVFGTVLGITECSNTNRTALGYQAGNTNQGTSAVAIGYNAGASSQGAGSIAIGKDAGICAQSIGAIAVGQEAGKNCQGANSIAIGAAAGATSQAASSIAINAQGACTPLNPSTSGFFVAPVRCATAASVTTAVGLGYCATTKEILYGVSGGGGSSNKIQCGTAPVISTVEVNNGGPCNPARGIFSINLACYATCSSRRAGLIQGESGINTARSVFLGVCAGTITCGCRQSSVAIGYYAGTNNQAFNTVAVGANSGGNNQGVASVAIGYNAGVCNQATGAVAIGASAGNLCQGACSVAVGANAQTNTGANAVAIGGSSSAANNGVALGYGTVADGSIAIGYYNNAPSGSIVIGAQVLNLPPTTCALYIKPIRCAAAASVTSAVGLGYCVGTNEVVYGVSGSSSSIKAPCFPYTGQVTIDVGGAVYAGIWCNSNLSGAPLVPTIKSTFYNTALGNYAGYAQGCYSVAIGTMAAGCSSGGTQSSEAVAIGNFAGYQSQGYSSVAIGSSAGKCSQPANSIAINASGPCSPLNPTTSGFFVAPVRCATASCVTTAVGLGYCATTKEIVYGVGGGGGTSIANGLTSIEIPNSNGAIEFNVAAAVGCCVVKSPAGKLDQEHIAFGYSAGASCQSPFAVAIGHRAGVNSQSSYAIAIGQSSGTTQQGQSSIAIGHHAGDSLQGAQSIAIGEFAGCYAQGASSIAIGYNAAVYCQPANSIAISALGCSPLLPTASGFFVAPIRCATASCVTGAVGLGYCATNKEIVYGGNSTISSLGVGTAASGTTGEIRATNNITAYYSSDSTLKENIKDVDGALEKVCAIGSKTFDWTDAYIAARGGEDGYFVQKSDFGVVAQDVQAVFPQAVRTRQDGTLAVDYEKLATLAFGAIKELVKRVEALEAK